MAVTAAVETLSWVVATIFLVWIVVVTGVLHVLLRVLDGIDSVHNVREQRNADTDEEDTRR